MKKPTLEFHGTHLKESAALLRSRHGKRLKQQGKKGQIVKEGKRWGKRNKAEILSRNYT